MAARDYGQYCGITRALELDGDRPLTSDPVRGLSAASAAPASAATRAQRKLASEA
jgi:hypothetical protein